MTRSLFWYWEAGGPGMYPLTLLLMLGVAVAVVGLILLAADRTSRALGPLALALAALSLVAVLTGALARSSTIVQAETAVVHANPADHDIILDAAREEAQIPLWYSLLIGAPLGLAAAAVGLMRRSAPAAPGVR